MTTTQDLADRARANDSDSPAAASGRQLYLTLLLVLGVIAFSILLFAIMLFNEIINVNAKKAFTNTSVIETTTQRVQHLTSSLQTTQKDAQAGRLSQEQSLIGPNATNIDDTLLTLQRGGPITDTNGNIVTISPIHDEGQLKQLSLAIDLWKPVKDRVNAFTQESSPDSLDRAVKTAVANNAQIADALEQISSDIGHKSEQSAILLNSIRNILLALGVVTFLAIIGSLLGRVRESQDQLGEYAADLESRNLAMKRVSDEISEAKASSDIIMGTVSLGLFLMDRNFRISGQYSKELEQIFRVRVGEDETINLEGFNILNMMQKLLTERMFNMTRDYFNFLFDKRKKQRTLLQVNPLTAIELSFPDPVKGGYTSRWLSFSFRRIVQGGEIVKVFTAVNDITDRVKLENELRLSEQKKERQFEFLLGVLHIEPAQLDDFVSSTRRHLGELQQAMRSEDLVDAGDKMKIFRAQLDVAFRSVHSIKGHAAMLNLPYFVGVCQQFEGKIVGLRNRMAIDGEDFLSVLIEQSKIQKDIDELQEVRERFVGIGPAGAVGTVADASLGMVAVPAVPVTAPTDDLVASLAELAATVGRANGKTVRVETRGFDSRLLSEEARWGVRDVLIQLTRNAVVHGVETPQERQAAGKNPTATITITRTDDGASGRFAFAFRDDGRGLDPETIRERAIAKGVITREEATRMSSGQIVGLIFRPGFSTAENVTTDAGRGVGMNIVKDVIVDKLKGRMNLNSKPHRFTEFSFDIPLIGGGRRSELVMNGAAN